IAVQVKLLAKALPWSQLIADFYASEMQFKFREQALPAFELPLRIVPALLPGQSLKFVDEGGSGIMTEVRIRSEE
ncbi:MAG: hypothetical protein LQ346_008863, partial [Caloplaca aetnensis]